MAAPSPTVIQPPNIDLPAIRIVDGSPDNDQKWYQFFISLVALPFAIEELTPGVSPYDFTASLPGFLLISGGTVSALALTRGRVTIDPLPMTSGFIPMGLQDILTITYTIAPDLWFVPR